MNVKNAYDADATNVRVELRGTGGDQFLRVQDDGTGMSSDDLMWNWGVLATENKLRDDRSPQFRRKRLGQKGVGRFATEKLGHRLLLRTRTAGQREVSEIKINWDDLRGDRDLGEYEFPIRRTRPDAYEPSHGTRLEVRSLRVEWKKARAQKLRSQLARLIDPETAASDFKITLLTPWEELNGPLQNPLTGCETHRLEFEISSDGVETVRIFSPDKKEVEAITTPTSIPAFGPIRGRLRYFGQGLASAERSRGGDPDADWNVGIRVFRDGCRVRPYGEPGPEGDWLQIYRARYLKGSRFKLKPHYLEGTVHITKDENPDLRDTTSREGLNANDCYAAFVQYVQGKVAALSDLLLEEQLHEERSRMRERYHKALQPLTEGLNRVRSDEYSRAVDSADAEVRKGATRVTFPMIRNSHWECLDCGDSWKVPLELSPARCREFSVGRDGKPSKKPGCGSTDIRHKENVPRNESKTPAASPSLHDVLAGMPAYVTGKQLRPIIDWEMGENDEESEVRADRRELAINGRHASFRAADALDGNETVEGTTFEALRAVAALTIHVINAASQAWGRWHYRQWGADFDTYLRKATELKDACVANIRARDAGQVQTDEVSVAS